MSIKITLKILDPLFCLLVATLVIRLLLRAQ